MADDVRGGALEPDEEAELHGRKHDREDDAGERDHQPDLVVEQVASGEGRHHDLYIDN